MMPCSDSVTYPNPLQFDTDGSSSFVFSSFRLLFYFCSKTSDGKFVHLTSSTTSLLSLFFPSQTCWFGPQVLFLQKVLRLIQSDSVVLHNIKLDISAFRLQKHEHHTYNKLEVFLEAHFQIPAAHFYTEKRVELCAG